ncbi:5550_t:CDS:2 [Paraglomus brasilianum]|uniref:5550_t:CDS:1 n=1 Tax=Paraglomus brasilianum TaxID=144538 RepID=A0A9N9GBW3_9GLOM|nr:5550_t:CDS:2 [Paraglomus brasilianum]
MVLEATMIVLDNSEWMRNGDYMPTRMEAQNDAVNLIFASKTQLHPENTVGLMTMAGKGPEVLVTPTADIGKILAAMHKTKIGGKASITTGIQVAQLALKHRQNKNQSQRIIVFVGSPIDAEEKTLIRLAKKTKKNSVAVDIVSFGEGEENERKLEAFMSNVNAGNNSHLVTIPPGTTILSQTLIQTPIVMSEDGDTSMFNGGSNFDLVDPNLDPELALAIRISLEEDKARREQEAAKATGAHESESSTMALDSTVIEEEQKLLNAALSASMETNDGDIHMHELTEEELMERAIAMSMQQAEEQSGSNNMSDVLGSLPGLDADDPRLKDALEDLARTTDTKEDDKSPKDTQH